MRHLLAIAGSLATLGLAACGSDGDGSTSTQAPPATTTEEAATTTAEPAPAADQQGGGAEATKPDATGTRVVAGESQFGTILFDSKQQAIYLFDKETSSKSECSGACAAAWPPVITDGDPRAGSGIDGKLLGTTDRDDGSTQVTYNGHPLYYYVDDPPGDVLCHNVDEFGGLWLVVEPGGDAVS